MSSGVVAEATALEGAVLQAVRGNDEWTASVDAETRMLPKYAGGAVGCERNNTPQGTRRARENDSTKSVQNQQASVSRLAYSV